MITTCEHWINAQAGFKLLELTTVKRMRIDILREIRCELCAALEQSNNFRFQSVCHEQLLVVALELNELLPQEAEAA